MENTYNPPAVNKDKSLEERTSEILKKLDDYMLFDELHEKDERRPSGMA